MDNFLNHISSFSVQTLIVLYFISNAFRIVSYVPQIIQVAKQQDDVRAISLWTWGMWTVSNTTTALYALFVLEKADFMLAALNFGNALGCLSVILIVIAKRKAYAVKNAQTYANTALV